MCVSNPLHLQFSPKLIIKYNIKQSARSVTIKINY